MLSDQQIERYSRQIILPQVGGGGQKRLLQASVLVSGESSLQAGALLYLAAAGVGRLGIYGIKELSTVAALSPEPSASALPPRCRGLILIARSLFTTIALSETMPTSNPSCPAIRPRHCRTGYELHVASTRCAAIRRGQVSPTIGWLAVYRGYEENLPCLFCETRPPSEATANGGVDKFMGPFIGTVLATEAIKVILGLHPPGPTKLLAVRFPRPVVSRARPLEESYVCRLWTAIININLLGKE